ncbi:hypothetical protein OG272_01445 [Streptomyces sp. NBC_00104]|uniref:hypothetical protein n=1 Tax=unclassified Streptomyces TaxID=2593676 RepID=UPI00324A974D
MNKALGIDLTVKPTDGNNYRTIVPTMTSAKKLPDWIQLPAWWNSGFNTGGLAGTQLADLTPYPAGDKIKKVPEPGRPAHRRLAGGRLGQQDLRHPLTSG